MARRPVIPPGVRNPFPRHSLRPLLPAALAALVLAAASLPHQAAAYRFLGFGPHSTVVTTSSWPPYITWDPNFWPPGETAEISIVEDPAWGPGTWERVKRLTEDAIRYWSEIETADLDFTVRLVSPETFDSAENGLFVTLQDEDWPARARGGASIGSLDERLVFSRCRVSIPDYYLSSGLGTAYVVYVLVHEFGHCFGLSHSAAYPDIGFREQLSEVQLGLDPVMSYGVNPTRRFEVSYGRGRLDLITPDDAVGISLLRPRSGWLEATGSVWGAVLQDDGSPVRFAPVLAKRLEDGEPSPFGVSAFTDSFGFFSIDGLEPGDYLVKVHPVLITQAHSNLLARATLEFPETTLIGSVAVRAGQRSGPLTIHVRPEGN